MTKQSPNNRECVLIALFHLGGEQHAIETEDLAMQVAQLAPSRFRWKKYPEQIDLEAVCSAAKSLSRGASPLVVGAKRDGWMLTRPGIAWCIASKQKRAVALSLSGMEIDPRLLLRQTEAFRKYQSREPLSVHDLRQFLRIDDYSSKRRRRERIQAVLNAAGDDTELRGLIEYTRTLYPEEWQ